MTRIAIALACLLASAPASAEDAPAFELHAQATYLSQYKSRSPAPYGAVNSLRDGRESSYTFTSTLYAGFRLGPATELYFNPELVRGRPISALHGLGGFTNGEVQRGVSARLAQLEADNLRLRAALLVSRSALLWGLGPSAALAGADGMTSAAMPASAHRVLCQVGCEGHAHVWLDEGGQCRRTGSACDALATPANG